MPASEGIASYGFQVLVGDGASSEAFTTIGEVINFDNDGPTVDEVEFTHLESPNAYKEFGAGLIDPGTLTGTMNFTADEYIAVLANVEGRANHNIELVAPDTGETLWDLVGYFSNVGLSVPAGSDRVTSSFAIRLTGQPSLTS